MVGLAIQIVSFIIVATAVIYGVIFLLGLLGLGLAAGGAAIKSSAKQEPKPELIPDNQPMDENEFNSLLGDYSDIIQALQDPTTAVNYAISFESRFTIGKRLMRTMLNIENFYEPRIGKQIWKNTLIPQKKLKRSKDALALIYNNLEVLLLPESKETQYGDYDDDVYRRTLRVLQGKNVVFEETLNYRDHDGSYYFLTDINKRFSKVNYSPFVFKPSQWLLDLFNLCIEDVEEFKRIQKQDTEMKLIASQKKIKEDFYPV